MSDEDRRRWDERYGADHAAGDSSIAAPSLFANVAALFPLFLSISHFATRNVGTTLPTKVLFAE